jgi:hypothetical protein
MQFALSPFGKKIGPRDYYLPEVRGIREGKMWRDCYTNVPHVSGAHGAHLPRGSALCAPARYPPNWASYCLLAPRTADPGIYVLRKWPDEQFGEPVFRKDHPCRSPATFNSGFR